MRMCEIVCYVKQSSMSCQETTPCPLEHFIPLVAAVVAFRHPTGGNMWFFWGGKGVSFLLVPKKGREDSKWGDEEGIVDSYEPLHVGENEGGRKSDGHQRETRQAPA